jgi:PTH1 family peptidyl-tRNA hydrolase
MKLIVGLGNIGSEYAKTNHNAGFMVLDRVAEKYGFSFKNRGCDADYAEFKNLSDKYIIAKPRTYMNDSGKAVKSLMKKFGIDIQDVLVVVDDIDQEPGLVRIRKTGSAGTHNGLKSIIAETGTADFARVRVGIGKQKPHQDLANFVLSKMHMSDEQVAGLEKAFFAVCDYIEGKTIENLMASYNGDSGKNGRH